MNIDKLNNSSINTNKEIMDKKNENTEVQFQNKEIEKNPIDLIIDNLSLEDDKKLLKEIFNDTKEKINAQGKVDTENNKQNIINNNFDYDNLRNYLESLKYNIKKYQNEFPYQDDLQAFNAYLKYSKTKEGKQDIIKNGIYSYIKFLTPDQRIKIIDRLMYVTQKLEENYKELENVELVPNIRIKKWESAPPVMEKLDLEEIKDGKVYRHHVDIEPDRGRAYVSTFTDDENGNPINIGRYEIREDMIFDMTKGKTGFRKTLPKEVIDLLYLLRDKGVDFGNVRLDLIASNKDSKIYNLLNNFDSPLGGMGYTILGATLGSVLLGTLGASIMGGPIIGAIFGLLAGGLLGSTLDNQAAINYALKGNIFYEKEEFKKKTKISDIL